MIIYESFMLKVIQGGKKPKTESNDSKSLDIKAFERFAQKVAELEHGIPERSSSSDKQDQVVTIRVASLSSLKAK